jgi:predicted dinucleotide-binding enzyme
MKIAVVGSGHVGSALAEGWKRAGHDVMYASREQGSEQAAIPSRSYAEALKSAEVVALCIPWPAVEPFLKENKVSGKIVVDCTNPLGPDLSLVVTGNDSAGERVAKLASGAKVVKAFNSTGFGNMRNPQIKGEKITMLYAGDDSAANDTVKKLISDIGFEPIYLGPIQTSRLLEHFASIWITLSMRIGGDFALQVARR